ncbi:homoserine kinase [Patescibacteria group bacterium]|nr:homoserine kinase [Patescibacteria group bacterium]MBU1951734.1 homoserine kinase [Patescibacteria group bacterium]
MDVKINKRKINSFLTNYEIGSLVSIEHIKKGFANRVFYLKTTKGEYILKIVVRNNPNNRFKYELELLEHLKGKGLPIPEIVKARNNKLFLRHQDHATFIYKYLPGKQLSRFSVSMYKQLGIFLGRLHNETTKFKSLVNRMQLYNISPTTFKRQATLSRKTNDAKLLNAIGYIEKNMLTYLLPPSLPEGAMHIDVKPENILFKNGQLSGVVDFDNSYIGPLVFDLAHTLMWLCVKNGKFDLKKVKVVYDAYNEVRKLTKAEKDNMLKALHYSCLSHSFVDVYFKVHRKELKRDYVYWGIDNLLVAQKYLLRNKSKFKKIFK